MYGVGYPVMNNVIGGHVVIGLILLFLVSKILATSLTLSIGGSGGVFAPSLFIGAMAGMAFGTVAHSLFGPTVGPPALYAVVAMGGVFAAAAQAPLTAIASVAEMTGNFTLTLPIMLASGVAAAISKQMSYGSVYTTKLLRRGIDIERPKTANLLATLTVADVMQPIPGFNGQGRLVPPGERRGNFSNDIWERLLGAVGEVREPQELFPDETLEQALRQLTLYGQGGLPVVSNDRQRVQGWITREGVLRALGDGLRSSSQRMERGAVAADFGDAHPEARAHTPSTPLHGYEIAEIDIASDSPGLGRELNEISWPAGSHVAALARGREIISPGPDQRLQEGDRVIILAPTGSPAGAKPMAGLTSGQAQANPNGD
jgi:CIC family chloride channel protein